MSASPTLDEYVHAFHKATDFIDATVTAHRAPLRERTVFGPAGRAVLRSAGERVLYGRNGEVIGRVIEDEMHNTQIEEDERLSAVIRLPQFVAKVHRRTREVISLEQRRTHT
jgi:hypothetical protein